MQQPERNIAAAKHFDDRATEWTAIYEPSHGRYRYFQSRKAAIEVEVRQLAQAQTLERVVDVGCGSGPYLPVLAKYSKSVYGIDVAPNMLKETAANVGTQVPRLTLAEGSATSIPFPDRHFDLSIYVGVFEYFDDVMPVLSEAKRVIVPGGHVIATVPHLWGIGRISGLPRTATLFAPPRWKLAVGSRLDKLRGIHHDPSKYYLGAAYRKSTIVSRVTQAGFQISRIVATGFQVRSPLRFLLGGKRSDQWEDAMQLRRHGWPWRTFGDDLILVLQRPLNR